jgi:hypothetical protein
VEEDTPVFEMLSVKTLVKSILIMLQLLRWTCGRDGQRTGYLICIFCLASDLFEEMFTVYACLSSPSSLNSIYDVRDQTEICIEIISFQLLIYALSANFYTLNPNQFPILCLKLSICAYSQMTFIYNRNESR